MSPGRPSTYTSELAERICDLVASTPVSTTKLCEKYDWMPHVTTLNLWRYKDVDGFSSKYLKAKSFQSELIVELIDNMHENISYYTDHEGNERIDAPSASLAIAQANNRKWVAARLAPRIYGDKKQTEEQSPAATLTKIQALVADLNKTNVSDI
jgi:hypothetical protein